MSALQPFDAPAGGPRKQPPARLRLESGAEPVPGYRLVQELDRGGFGEVWQAVGPQGQAAALKFLRLGSNRNPPEATLLRLLQDIDHPHLLRLYASWQLPGFLVIAMELADGTLLDRDREAKAQGLPAMPAAELIRYMREAASAIDYLNQAQHMLPPEKPVRGPAPANDSEEAPPLPGEFCLSLGSILHRDIKPQNLLLVGGRVKVADFGLAKFSDHTATSHSKAMTPAYAAPEFFKGKTSSRSDQYSLAVTYCRLRCGRLPFSGTPAEMMAGHLTQPPDLTQLPEGERPAVWRALAKDPEARWPSCQEFVEALVAGDSGMRAAPHPLPAEPGDPKGTAGSRRAGRESERWPVMVAVAAMLVTAGVFGIAWCAPLLTNARDKEEDRVQTMDAGRPGPTDRSEAVAPPEPAADGQKAKTTDRSESGAPPKPADANDKRVEKDKRKTDRQDPKPAEPTPRDHYYLGIRYAQLGDYREAVRCYRQAAEQGHAAAQYNLGWCYENGRGAEKDAREAVRWYGKAAEQGHPLAQVRLGHCYLDGRGVARDARAAVKWFRQAAAQGNARAQLSLGFVYEAGRGVAKDTREAIRWYRKAANQGDKNAVQALRRLTATHRPNPAPAPRLAQRGLVTPGRDHEKGFSSLGRAGSTAP
jgi:TPR repeat protein